MNELQLELKMLRLQLNPHFLGNSLNTICSLIRQQKADQAAAVTQRLSDFLRMTLEPDGEMVSLADELDTIDAYLRVEHARFGDALEFEVDCTDEALAVEIPGFLLQPLVENCVKHACPPAANPLRIKLVAEARGARMHLCLVDNGQLQERASFQRTGIGLANVTKRLKLHYGESANMTAVATKAGFRVDIALPR